MVLNETYTTNLLLMYSDFKRKHVNEQTIENHIAPASKLNWFEASKILTLYLRQQILLSFQIQMIFPRKYIYELLDTGVKQLLLNVSLEFRDFARRRYSLQSFYFYVY